MPVKKQITCQKTDKFYKKKYFYTEASVLLYFWADINYIIMQKKSTLLNIKSTFKFDKN